jgi:hypothetical protein
MPGMKAVSNNNEQQSLFTFPARILNSDLSAPIIGISVAGTDNICGDGICAPSEQEESVGAMTTTCDEDCHDFNNGFCSRPPPMTTTAVSTFDSTKHHPLHMSKVSTRVLGTKLPLPLHQTGCPSMGGFTACATCVLESQLAMDPSGNPARATGMPICRNAPTWASVTWPPRSAIASTVMLERSVTSVTMALRWAPAVFASPLPTSASKPRHRHSE